MKEYFDPKQREDLSKSVKQVGESIFIEIDQMHGKILSPDVSIVTAMN